MPLTQRSSQAPSSAKKQQSISSFFTKTTPVSLAPTSLANATSDERSGRQANQHELGDRTESLFVNSDEDIPNGGPPWRQTSKRAIHETEIVNNEIQNYVDFDLPERKRLRLLDNAGTEKVDDDRVKVMAGLHQTSPNTKDQTLHPITANGFKKVNTSERTSKYLFSSLLNKDQEPGEGDAEAQKRKERLHQRFVKKLGQPDSITKIKRRNWHSEEVAVERHLDADDIDSAEEDQARRAKGSRKKGSTMKAETKLTPMEKQVLEIKNSNPETLLIIEVGYKFRFFGEDARIAARELSIVCIPGKLRYDEHPSEAHLERFASASIPVHRLHVHVKRLVSAGHKVGVVRQLETAALKAAGDNRNTPFARKLTNLYTKGTYIDDIEGLEGPVEGPTNGAPASGYLLCICENRSKGWGTDEKVHVGIVAVQPATGDVIYDDFEDGFMRSEIETRLLHIAPCEILIVGRISKATEKLVQHLSSSKTNIFGDKVRVERVSRPKTMAALAYSHVSNFYAGKMKSVNRDQDERASTLLDKVLKLAENVTICLSAMITHMSEYGLENVFDLTKYFQSFSARSHMLLNGTTLTSLEIYQNQTDHCEKGSLFWTLDRTQTRFGQRLLRKWVGRPLLDRAKLEERIGAVEELKDDKRSLRVDRIKHLLFEIKGDLEKSLIRIYYGKVGTMILRIKHSDRA